MGNHNGFFVCYPFTVAYLFNEMKKENITSRTKYLNYIEDTQKHRNILENIAVKAAENAVEYAKANGQVITYLEGNDIVQESPDGSKQVIKSLDLKTRQVNPGDRDKL